MVRRTLYENVVDRFLLLYLISEASECAPNLGKTKLQKLTFLSEWKLIDDRNKGFNYNYIKLVHGPYSGELNNDLTDLAIHNLVNDPRLYPTDVGYRILEDFSELLEQNEPFILTINQVISRFVMLSLNKLLAFVYSLQHPYRKNLTIGKTPFRTPLLYRLSDDKTIAKFRISEEQLEDLQMCLDKERLKQWKEVKDEVSKGRFLTYREVFGTVNTKIPTTV